MRPLNRREIAAMRLWGAEYARLGCGAIEFYKRIDASRKRMVEAFLRELDEARA